MTQLKIERKILTSLTRVFMVFSLSALLTNTFASSEQEGNVGAKLTGSQLRACVIALRDFEPRGYSLEHFTIEVKDHPKGVEVWFVPNFDGNAGRRGGGNSYGKEVRYVISPAGEIEQIGYSR